MRTDENKFNKPDVVKLMEQIRAKVKAELAFRKEPLTAFKPKQTSFDQDRSVKVGELINSEDLLFLNRNYIYSGSLQADLLNTERRGMFGRLILAIKRKLLKVIKDGILRNYLAYQQEFFVHLVRYLNKTSVYVDSRDGDIFWQLINKLDTDIGKANERIERIRQEVLGALQTLEKHNNQATRSAVDQINASLGALLAEQARHSDQLQTLDSVTRGLESILARYGLNNNFTKPVSSEQEKSVESECGNIPDLGYLLLENRFRGSEHDIQARQQFYAEYFKDSEKAVLDVGCGRGEFLELLINKGIPAKGLDLNQAMVDICHEKNLSVEKCDLIEYLQKTEDKSLGGLIALQVVEHLPRQVLSEFISLAQKKIVVGGRIILETINPTSMTALSSNYFRDPTHVFPQHPDSLGFLLSSSGWELLETKFLSPVPESARLRELPEEIYMTPKWREMVQLFNHNIRVLNSVIFGFQDYCVIGRALD